MPKLAALVLFLSGTIFIFTRFNAFRKSSVVRFGARFFKLMKSAWGIYILISPFLSKFLKLHNDEVSDEKIATSAELAEIIKSKAAKASQTGTSTTNLDI